MIQPLKINKKVDNDAKLAQIIKENIPASEFMSADEVNAMVGKINEMVPAINVSNGGFQGVLEINEKRVDSGFYIPTESGTFINAGNVVVDLSQGINFVTYDGDKWDVALVPITTSGKIEEGDTGFVSGGEVFSAVTSKVKFYNDIKTFNIIKDFRISAEGLSPEVNNIVFKISFENVIKTSDRIFVSNHLPSTYRYIREDYDGNKEIITTSTTGGFNALLINENTKFLYAWVCRAEHFPNGIKPIDYKNIRLSWTKSEYSDESELVEFRYGKITNTDVVFQKDANFLKTWQTDYLSNYFLKKAIKKIQIHGMPSDSKVSLYVIEFTSNKQKFIFYKDIGDGSGKDKEVLMTIETNKEDLSKIHKIEGKIGDIEIIAFIDYSQMKSSSSNTYSSCGFSEHVFLNFKKGSNSQPSEKRGVIDITLVNNNSDSPVLDDNRLTDIYTVIPDLIQEKTAGCTGLGFDCRRDLFIVSQYSYANLWYLNFYRKEDLMIYDNTSDLEPKPYHQIDLRQYLNSIQGNCYDVITDSYYVVGNGYATNGKRVIIRVDYQGNLLEFTELVDIPESYQNGMLAIDPITNNIYFSVNNAYELYLLDRNTKKVVKTILTNQIFEGMGVNQKNGDIMLAGDGGDVRLFDKDFNIKGNYLFKTFPNENSTQNIEGIIFLDDDSVVFSADCFLHGGTKNGNALFFFDFFKTKSKHIKYPFLLSSKNINSRMINNTLIVDDTYTGVIVDCESYVVESIINQFGSNIIQFESSNNKPIGVEKYHRGVKYYEEWGSIIPEKNYNNRYVRVIVKHN